MVGSIKMRRGKKAGKRKLIKYKIECRGAPPERILNANIPAKMKTKRDNIINILFTKNILRDGFLVVVHLYLKINNGIIPMDDRWIKII